MSKKPKAQNYKPSESDKANAAVALAEYNRFKEKYDPLLVQMRDKSMSDDPTKTLRGRANADTMQALTEGTNFQQTQNLNAGADMSAGLQGQLGVANQSGANVQNQMQTNVLGTARGQAADAQKGMANASRLATSEALARAKANQDVANAKFNMAGQLAGSVIGSGLQNMQTRSFDGSKKGTFFAPVDARGEKVNTPFQKMFGE